MNKINIAILGATGAVGQEMIKVLYERNFPIQNLKLLASARSAGKVLDTPFGKLTVEEASKESFKGSDIVLGASENNIAEKFADDIKSSGAIFIDNSSAFRLDDDVPLIVPEINPDDIKNNKGIISNPNCSTIITLVAINGLSKLSKIEGIYASTYQATSGAGAGGPVEMHKQTEDILNNRDFEPRIFSRQIAYNLIPQIGNFGENLYSSEEMKLQNEGRKILHLPDLNVSCTCVRVPVERSHSISASVILSDEIDLESAKKAISDAKGCKLYSEDNFPTPIETSGQDLVYVGRIRKDLVNPRGINLWCCGDQVRKGAATNAVQIAELLI